MKHFFREICKLHAVSSEEDMLLKFCFDELSKYSNSVIIDKNNNLIATLGDRTSSRRILIDAHVDEIGFIVTNITDEGFIKVASVGGVDKRILPGSPVVVLSQNEVFGVFASTPPHLQKDTEEFLSIDKLFIDTGLCADKIKNMVKPGDKVVLYSTPVSLLNNRVSSGSLDNKAGIMTLVRCAQILSTEQPDALIYIVLSSREEVNSLGAKTCAFSLEPTESICVDVSFASQPNVPSHKCGILTKGPMIGISPTLCKDMYNELIAICKENKIAYQLEVMGGKTGTNADYISESKCGVKSALVSIPQRYMHTACEVVDLNDIENAARLIVLYILNSKGVSL